MSSSGKASVVYLPQFRDDADNNACFLKAGTTSFGLRVPAADIGGNIVYPVCLPGDTQLRKFLIALWPHLAAGEIHNVDDWRELLSAEGIGWKRKGKVAPYGDYTTRRFIREAQMRTWLPIVSKATDEQDNNVDDDEAHGHGIGLARSRKQADDEAARLRGRVKLIHEAVEGIAKTLKADDGYFTEQPRQLEPVRGLTAEQQALLLAELGGGIPRTNEQLAMTLVTGEPFTDLEGRELSTEQSEVKERLKGYRVRCFIHDLRWQGVPVCANGTGYRIAENADEAREYGNSLLLRAARIAARAERLSFIGLLWFPATQTEREATAIQLDRWAVKPLLVPESADERRQKARAAAIRAELSEAEQEREQEAVGAAESFIRRHRGAVAYEQARQLVEHADALSGSGVAPAPSDPMPTEDERRLVARMRTAQKFLTAPSPRRHSAYPFCRRDDNPLAWERERGQKGKGKAAVVKGAEGVSASELLSKADERPQMKSEEPLPW